MRFIFMLTRNDVTIPEARSVLPTIADTGVRDVGCKDVGLSLADLQALFEDLREIGCTTYLEVVSESPDQVVQSARTAVIVQPDYLIGGTVVEPVQDIIAASPIRFFPYAGRVVGHPGLLRGSIEDIVADARRLEAAGADGINLLAYRYDGDPEALTCAVVQAVGVPVIAAGSIDSDERIADGSTMRRVGFHDWQGGPRLRHRAWPAT